MTDLASRFWFRLAAATSWPAARSASGYPPPTTEISLSVMVSGQWRDQSRSMRKVKEWSSWNTPQRLEFGGVEKDERRRRKRKSSANKEDDLQEAGVYMYRRTEEGPGDLEDTWAESRPSTPWGRTTIPWLSNNFTHTGKYSPAPWMNDWCINFCRSPIKYQGPGIPCIKRESQSTNTISPSDLSLGETIASLSVTGEKWTKSVRAIWTAQEMLHTASGILYGICDLTAR